MFSDALGWFGAEIERDDGYVYYGGFQRYKEGSLPGRLITVDGIPACGRKRRRSRDKES